MAKSKSTVERILDAAEARFAATGYSATSVGEIADAVGIRGPSLYKHFETKRDLYNAVMKRLLDPYFEMLTSLLVPPRDARQAQANLETVVSHYYDTPNLARLMQHAALAGGDEVDGLMKEWLNPFFRRAAQLTPPLPALADGDARDSAFLVMAFHSIMSGYITMAPLHRPLLGEDPLGKRARARHLDFLQRLARGLWQSRR
jgi:TetR/AcrR family transcriptional regulator